MNAASLIRDGTRPHGTRHRTSRNANIVRLGLRILSVISPPVAAASVERIWFQVPERPVDPGDLEVLHGGTPISLAVGTAQVAGWSWGKGPAVLLVHGWGGRATDMRSFVQPLAERGYRVVLFDAPGHGDSSGGSRDDRQGLLGFRAALLAFQRRLGTVHGVVAHSGGATALALALREGLRARRAVLIAPLNDVSSYAAAFSRALGLTNRVQGMWMEKVERRLDRSWNDFAVTIAPHEVETPPVLVIHDREDREVPFEDGVAIAKMWPHSSLHPVQNLGHRRLLRDQAVVTRVTSFIAGVD